MYHVHLPAREGKLQGWLRGTVFTAAVERATLYATTDEAQLAIAKAAKFHLKRTIRVLQIVEVANDAPVA